jgi:SHS2 domain-containing protein
MPNDKFHFLEDIATADLAFEAFGKNYSELFKNAGLALEEAMVETKSVQSKINYEIELDDSNIENLLYLFLEELVYLKDAEELLFSKIKCRIKSAKNVWKFAANLGGERINRKKHKLRDDVKAVTKHLFRVKELPNKNYRCQVVLDV